MKASTFLKLIFLGTVLASCSKPDHSLRIKNQYPDTLINVTAGPASFGQVNPNETTGYISIPEGSSTLSGTDKSNSTIHLTGSVSVDGNGKHLWTMTINSNGTLSISKDK